MKCEQLESRKLLASGAGSLDKTFAEDGKLDVFLEGLYISDIAVQRDGKILLAGSLSQNGKDQLLVARLRSDGSLDSSFAQNGQRLIHVNGRAAAQAIAIDAKGRILVAGSSGGDVLMLRLTASGSLDKTFSGDGMKTIGFGGNDIAHAVFVTPQGKILAAGTDGRQMIVARLSSSGALDKDFDRDGKASLGGFSENAYALAQTPQGKVLVGGRGTYIESYVDGTGIIARLNQDGSPDATFARAHASDSVCDSFTLNPGVLVFGDARPLSLAVRPDGRILIGGYTNLSDAEAEVAELSADGNTLTSWGNPLGGRSWNEFTHDIVLQSNGKVLAIFDVEVPGSQLAIARYNVDGTLDESFGIKGLITAPIDGEAYPVAIAPAPNDKMVALGGNYGLGFSLARYDVGSAPFRAPFSVAEDGRIMVNGTTGNDVISIDPYGLTFNDERFDLFEIGSCEIRGGSGNDRISVSLYHTVRVYGDDGNDVIELNTDAASNLARGGRGDDQLFGSFGDDALFGDEGNDLISAREGNDFLSGLAGNDTLHGDDGNDVLDGGSGADQFSGGAGDDTADYHFRMEPQRIILDDQRNDGATGEGDNIHSDVETILGGGGADLIRGGKFNNFLKGNGGNDTLIGGGGSDTLVGGKGRDQLFGDAGDDLFSAHDGLIDTLTGGAGADRADRDSNDLLSEIETVL